VRCALMTDIRPMTTAGHTKCSLVFCPHNSTTGCVERQAEFGDVIHCAPTGCTEKKRIK
jgi:hypothetical protein